MANESRTVEFVWLCTGFNCSEIYLYDAGHCVECHHELRKCPAWRRTHKTSGPLGSPTDSDALIERAYLYAKEKGMPLSEAEFVDAVIEGYLWAVSDIGVPQPVSKTKVARDG